MSPRLAHESPYCSLTPSQKVFASLSQTTHPRRNSTRHLQLSPALSTQLQHQHCSRRRRRRRDRAHPPATHGDDDGDDEAGPEVSVSSARRRPEPSAGSRFFFLRTTQQKTIPRSQTAESWPQRGPRLNPGGTGRVGGRNGFGLPLARRCISLRCGCLRPAILLTTLRNHNNARSSVTKRPRPHPTTLA